MQRLSQTDMDIMGIQRPVRMLMMNVEHSDHVYRLRFEQVMQERANALEQEKTTKSKLSRAFSNFLDYFVRIARVRLL